MSCNEPAVEFLLASGAQQQRLAKEGVRCYLPNETEAKELLKREWEVSRCLFSSTTLMCIQGLDMQANKASDTGDDDDNFNETGADDVWTGDVPEVRVWSNIQFHRFTTYRRILMVCWTMRLHTKRMRTSMRKT